MGSEAASVAPPLLSPGAWEALELELSRDSELRLLIVVMWVRLVDMERENTGAGGVLRISFGDAQAQHCKGYYFLLFDRHYCYYCGA